MTKRTSVLFFVLYVPLLALAQSKVPIDSPRGNYEGADNVHWYQQQSLKAEDYVGLPPLSGLDFFCNGDDLRFDCFGDLQAIPQESYYALGDLPIIVTVLVDTRQTPGFDFPHRRALDAIRRTNDAFRRSGVNARLLVSRIRDFNFDARGYSASPRDIYRQVYDEEAQFIDAVSAEDGADVLMFVRNAENVNTDNLCGSATIGILPPWEYLPPIVVLAGESGNPRFNAGCSELVAPHEFGHILGLGHDNSAGESAPHLSFGRGFLNSVTGKGTIMHSSPNPRIPFFSSPLLVYEGAIYGDSNSADAVQAMNQSVTNAALFWEIRFSEFLSPLDSDSTVTSDSVDKAGRDFNVPPAAEEPPNDVVPRAIPRPRE